MATLSYNAIGKLTFKSDAGAYSYPAPGQPRPHGVVSVSGDTISATFTRPSPYGIHTSGPCSALGCTRR